jgi:hypothetical protein
MALMHCQQTKVRNHEYVVLVVFLSHTRLAKWSPCFELMLMAILIKPLRSMIRPPDKHHNKQASYYLLQWDVSKRKRSICRCNIAICTGILQEDCRAQGDSIARIFLVKDPASHRFTIITCPLFTHTRQMVAVGQMAIATIMSISSFRSFAHPRDVRHRCCGRH